MLAHSDNVVHVVNWLVLVTALIAVYQMRRSKTSVIASYNNESIGRHVALHDIGSFTFGFGLYVQCKRCM